MKAELIDRDDDKPFMTLTFTKAEFRNFKNWLGDRPGWSGAGISGEIWEQIEDIEV